MRDYMLNYMEHEVVIVINDADLREGFFTIGTTRKSQYEKVLRRVGEQHILSTTVNKDPEGNPVWFSIKVSKKQLSWGLSTKKFNPNRVKRASNLGDFAKKRVKTDLK